MLLCFGLGNGTSVGWFEFGACGDSRSCERFESTVKLVTGVSFRSRSPASYPGLERPPENQCLVRTHPLHPRGRSAK